MMNNSIGKKNKSKNTIDPNKKDYAIIMDKYIWNQYRMWIDLVDNKVYTVSGFEKRSSEPGQQPYYNYVIVDEKGDDRIIYGELYDTLKGNGKILSSLEEYILHISKDKEEDE